MSAAEILQNSTWSLVVVYPTFTIPFCTGLLMGFFKALPVEIEEAPSVVEPILPDAKCRTFALADRNATLFVLIVEMFGRNGRTARLESISIAT
jgi:hypothetical protein